MENNYEKKDKQEECIINEIYRNHDNQEDNEQQRPTYEKQSHNPIPSKVWKAFNAIIPAYRPLKDSLICQYDQCTSSKSQKNHLSHLCYAYWEADPEAATETFWKATYAYLKHRDKIQYLEDMNTQLEGPSFDYILRSLRSEDITPLASDASSDESPDEQ